MGEVLLWVGRLAGLLGVLVCGVAFAARAASVWRVGSFQIGALAYVAYMAERRRE